MIQEHGRRELVGRGRRSGMPNERSDVGRCGEMHDAEQNEEHPTSSKQPNTSRCRHNQTLHNKTYHLASNEKELSYRWLRASFLNIDNVFYGFKLVIALACG
jgi:hypothetical protein